MHLSVVGGEEAAIALQEMALRFFSGVVRERAEEEIRELMVVEARHFFECGVRNAEFGVIKQRNTRLSVP